MEPPIECGDDDQLNLCPAEAFRGLNQSMEIELTRILFSKLQMNG